MENAAVERLQLRIKQTKIESVKQRLRLHLEETREQQNRLKQLISMWVVKTLQRKRHNCQFHGLLKLWQR